MRSFEDGRALYYLRTTSFGFFVALQAEKDGVTKRIVAGPLGELDLGDQHRFDPVATFHDRRGYALPSALRTG
jgi:hypothetical protein